MIQKIIKVGNSAALTLPKEFLDEAHLQIGDEMFVETNATAKMINAQPAKLNNKKTLTPEYFEWLDRTTKKYEKTIKELARV